MNHESPDSPPDFQQLLAGSGPVELVLPGLAPFPIRRANTFRLRLLGLMGQPETPEGLWLAPCDAIHMMFMRYSLDAVFLDRDGRITRVRVGVKPWGFAFGGPKAHSVLELPAGKKMGQRLTVGQTVPLRFKMS